MIYKVFKSDDGGSKFVKSESDDFIASYKDGEWSSESMFSRSEMDEMMHVEDPYEITVIVKQAKKALNRF